MSRGASFFVFIGIALTIVGLAHFYLWVRLVSDPGWPVGARRALTALLVLLYLSIPMTFYLGRVGDIHARGLLMLPAFGWLGVLFILLALVSTVDVARGIGALIQ